MQEQTKKILSSANAPKNIVVDIQTKKYGDLTALEIWEANLNKRLEEARTRYSQNNEYELAQKVLSLEIRKAVIEMHIQVLETLITEKTKN